MRMEVGVRKIYIRLCKYSRVIYDAKPNIMSLALNGSKLAEGTPTHFLKALKTAPSDRLFGRADFVRRINSARFYPMIQHWVPIVSAPFPNIAAHIPNTPSIFSCGIRFNWRWRTDTEVYIGMSSRRRLVAPRIILLPLACLSSHFPLGLTG